MLNKCRRLGLLVGFAVSVTASAFGPLSAQTPPPATAFRSLTLTLSVPARSFLLLEPVPLTITLENRTAEPVAAHAALSFSDGAVAVLVQPEGSPAYRVARLSPVAIYSRITPLTLPSGYKQASTEPLIVELPKVLPTPGKYAIQAILRNLNGDEIRSNVVSIEVTQPAGQDQLAYLFLIDSFDANDFFIGAGVAGKRELYDAYDAFARTYQGTVYADYANLSLAQVHAARREIATARRFFSNVTTRSEFAAHKAAEALKRLPAQ